MSINPLFSSAADINAGVTSNIFTAAVGSAAVPTITFAGFTTDGIYHRTTSTIDFAIAGVALAEFHTNGLRIGNPAANPTGLSGGLVVQGTASNTTNIISVRNSADANGVLLQLSKSRSATVGGVTILAANDYVGEIRAYGADGSTHILSSAIAFRIEGTPALGDVRSSISLRTGSAAGVVTEALRVDISQSVQFMAPAVSGYGAGSGGSVTQATNKSTGVTLSTPTGRIIMNNAALADQALVQFTVTNTLITLTDGLILTAQGSTVKYELNRAVATGSFVVQVKNISGGSLSEALVINFQIIKGSIT